MLFFGLPAEYLPILQTLEHGSEFFIYIPAQPLHVQCINMGVFFTNGALLLVYEEEHIILTTAWVV